eukprot:SAG31_NODE_2337_length_5921_cov_4.269323_4_plen_232_part_00
MLSQVGVRNNAPFSAPASPARNPMLLPSSLALPLPAASPPSPASISSLKSFDLNRPSIDLLVLAERDGDELAEAAMGDSDTAALADSAAAAAAAAAVVAAERAEAKMLSMGGEAAASKGTRGASRLSALQTSARRGHTPPATGAPACWLYVASDPHRARALYGISIRFAQLSRVGGRRRPAPAAVPARRRRIPISRYFNLHVRRRSPTTKFIIIIQRTAPAREGCNIKYDF